MAANISVLRFFLLVGCLAPQIAAEKQVDGGAAGASFVAQELTPLDFHALFAHHLLPRSRMAGHGIVKSSVHIYQGGFGAHFHISMAAQESGYYFVVHTVDESLVIFSFWPEADPLLLRA